MKETELVSLGQITKAQGLKGAFRVRAHGVESENLPRLDTLFIRLKDDRPKPFTVASMEQRKGFFVVSLKEITHIDQVAPLIDAEVLADRKSVAELDDGDYYWYELVGLKVMTREGKHLGVVHSIIPTGSNDVFQVMDGKREYLIPYIDEVVCEVNLESGVITIEPIPGLLD